MEGLTAAGADAIDIGMGRRRSPTSPRIIWAAAVASR